MAEDFNGKIWKMSIHDFIAFMINLRPDEQKESKMYPLVTLEDAKKVASVLLKDSRLCGVEVFGSVARHGKGHDLDLILLVQNRALATDFILQTNKAIDTEIAASDILSRLEDSIPSSPHSAYDFNLREKV